MKMLFLGITALLAGILDAHAQSIDSCEKAIKYNSEEITQNVATKLAVWDSIDQSTFLQRKQNSEAGIEIYGIPASFSWDQFNEERTRLRRQFSLQSDLKSFASSRWYAVDPESTDRYIACIDALTGKKFIASVALANKEAVFIRVKKNENPGQLNKDSVNVILVSGGRALRQKVTLKGTSSTTLAFERTANQPFSVGLALVDASGADIDSAQFSLPKYTKIVDQSEQITKTSNEVRCLQKDKGPASGPMIVNAEMNEMLLVGTQHVAWQVEQGSELGTVTKYQFDTLNSSTALMTAECASATDKQHTLLRIKFTIQARRSKFVDVGSQ